MHTPQQPLWLAGEALDAVASLRRWDQARQQRLRRAYSTLLAISLSAFALMVLALVRAGTLDTAWQEGSNPAGVVRAHLEALNRGQVRQAYELFSENYRRKNSYVAFQMLVRHHPQVFHTRLLGLVHPPADSEHPVIETRLLAADGKRYVARFTLVENSGRWWIDDLRWSAMGRFESREI